MNTPPPSSGSGFTCMRSLLLSILLVGFSPLATSAQPPAVPPAPAPAGAPTAPLPAGPPASDGAARASATEAPADAAAGGTRALDEQIQDLKKDVIDLNRDLFVLEEELLFPANTQGAVFVSMDGGDFFALDSISLKVDNHDVSNYLYTPREVAALIKGGVQRLYVGNLKAGRHELVALFNGKGPTDRYYRRGAPLKLEKGVGAKYLELKITDRARARSSPSSRSRTGNDARMRLVRQSVGLAVALLAVGAPLAWAARKSDPNK